MPQGHFDIVIESAGGVNGPALVAENQGPVDFLFRDQASFGVTDGIWGILRVEEPPAP